jgi:hypothetical protein
MDEETTGQSRLFVILAIALIGLLVLGLLGIGGVFVIRQNIQEQAALSVTSTPTLAIKLPDPTATSVPATKVVQATTVAPTPTNTPVVADGAEAAVGTVNDSGDDGGGQSDQGGFIPKPTPKAPTNSNLPEQVPDTGLGAIEAVLIAVGLIGVLFIARRMRMST